MSLDAEPQSAEPETSGTPNSGRCDNGNGNNDVEEHQKFEDGQNLKDTSEYEKERVYLQRITQSLVEEWKPEGFSETHAITELAALFWRRERIRTVAARTDERSPLEKSEGSAEKEKEVEDQTEEEKEVDVVSEIMRLGLSESPQEKMQREMTLIDRLIEKAVDHFVFLKTSKKRVRDCSSEEVTISRPMPARAPRGKYRRSTAEKQSDNSAPDLVPSNQTTAAK
jgi:hypothetical protein